jgi:hypothetical protein
VTKYTYDVNTPLHLLLYTQEDVILEKAGKKQLTVRVEAKNGYSDKIADKFLEGTVRKTIPMVTEHGIFTVNSECKLTERKGSICLRSIDNNEIVIPKGTIVAEWFHKEPNKLREKDSWENVSYSVIK